MKKTRLFGMFALTFALVFGAVSCAQPSAPAIEDVELKDLSLKGTWKCTKCEAEFKISDKEAWKALYGADFEESSETVDTPADLTFETEEEAQAFFKAAQEEAKAQKAEIEKSLDETVIKAAAEAECTGLGVTYVSSSADGDYSVTLDGDSVFTTESSSTESLTFKKGDVEYTLEVTMSSIVVFEKQ